MHCGAYTTPQSYPQLMHRVIHIENFVAEKQQNPVDKTGLGWCAPAPILTILFGHPRSTLADILDEGMALVYTHWPSLLNQI